MATLKAPWEEPPVLRDLRLLPCRTLQCGWPDLEAITTGPSRRFAVLRAPHCLGILDLRRGSLLDERQHPPGSPNTPRCQGGAAATRCLAVLPQPHRRLTCAVLLHEAYAAAPPPPSLTKRDNRSNPTSNLNLNLNSNSNLNSGNNNPTTNDAAEMAKEGLLLLLAAGDAQSMLTVGWVNSLHNANGNEEEEDESAAAWSTIFIGNTWDGMGGVQKDPPRLACSALCWVMPTVVDGSYVLCRRTCEEGSQGTAATTLWMASVEQERAWAVGLPAAPPSSFATTRDEPSLMALFDLRATTRGACSMSRQATSFAKKGAFMRGGSSMSTRAAADDKGGMVGAAYPHWATLHEASTLRPIATFPFCTAPGGWCTESFLRGEGSTGEGCGREATGHAYTLVLRRGASRRARNADCWWWACYDDRWPRSPVWWKRVQTGRGPESVEDENVVKKESNVEPTDDLAREAAAGLEKDNEGNSQMTFGGFGKGYGLATVANRCPVQCGHSQGFTESLGPSGFAFATLSHRNDPYRRIDGKWCGWPHLPSSLLELHTVQMHQGGRGWVYHRPSTVTHAMHSMEASSLLACDTAESLSVKEGALKSMIYYDGVLNLLCSS